MFPQACPSLFSIPVYSYHIFPLSLSLSSPLSHLPSPPLFLLLPCNSLLTHDPPCWVPPLGKYSLVSSFTFFSVRRYRAKILVNKILSYHRRWWRTVVSVQGALVLWTTDPHKSVSSERGQSSCDQEHQQERRAGWGRELCSAWSRRVSLSFIRKSLPGNFQVGWKVCCLFSVHAWWPHQSISWAVFPFPTPSSRGPSPHWLSACPGAGATIVVCFSLKDLIAYR